MTRFEPGAIALLGFNGSGTNDFSFLITTPIPAGTQIWFTDVGVEAGNFGNTSSGEGMVLWTAPVAHAAGSVVNYVAESAEFTIPPQRSAGTFNQPPDFADTGDQLIAFQASLNGLELEDVRFLFAIQSNSTAFQGSGDGLTGDTSDVTQSGLPDGLEEGSTALALGLGPGPEEFVANLAYAGPTTGTAASLRAAVADPANWTKSATALTQTTADFTVTDPDSGAEPVL